MFPQEIHNLIIDAVATIEPNRRKTLCTCASASRVLLYRAYHHLFSHIHIHLELNQLKSHNALRNFISLLRNSLRCPHVGIASHVRVFELTIHGRYNPSYSTVGHSLSELFRAVYSLTRFECLRLSSKSLMSFQLPAHGLYSISDDLVDLCHSPTLSKLVLSSLMDVPNSLLRDSCIRHIETCNVSFAPYPAEHRKFVHQPESVVVHGSGASFRSFINSLHGGGGSIDSFVRCQEAFTRLRTLEIRAHGLADVPEYLKMAAAASNSLDTLSLHIYADSRTMELSKKSLGDPKYFFHIISSLRTLRISFYHNSTWHPPESCFNSPLRHFLDMSTFPRSLQTLDIGASAYVHVDVHFSIKCDCRPTNQTRHWAQLDAVLTKPTIRTVPRVRLFVKFFIDGYEGYNPFYEDFFIARARNDIQDVLPDFHNTRLLPLTGQLFVICSSQPFHLSPFPFM